MNSCITEPKQNWFRKASALLAFAIAISIGFGAAGGSEPITLQLKWYHQFQFAGFYAAEKEGYFEEEGLSVSIQEGNPERPPLRTVLTGEADFGVTDCDVLLSRMRGNPVVACSAIFQHSPYIFLSLADSGIRTPADLLDRSIMVSNDQGSAQLIAMMRREGLPIDRLKMVHHTWDVHDLVSGNVEVISAYSTAEPSQVAALGHRTHIIRASDYGVDFYGDTLFTTEEFAERHPDQVDAMIRACNRGWGYAMDHSEEMIEHILALPGVSERGIKRENLEYEAAEMRRLIMPDLVEIGHMNEGRWRRTAETFIDTGIAYNPVDEDWFEGFLYQPTPLISRHHLKLIGAIVLGITLIALLVFSWNVVLKMRVEERTCEVNLERRKLHAILHNSANLQFLLSGSGRLLEANGTALAFGDIRKEEVLGLRFCETPWWNSSPSLEAQIQERIERIIGGEAGMRFEISLTDINGKQHSMDFFIRPVTNQTGRIEFIVAEGVDVTLLKKSAENARQSAELMQVLFDSALDATIGVDSHGMVVHWNERAVKIFGVSKEEAAGSDIARFLPELMEEFQPNKLSNSGGRFETTALRMDGRRIPAELSVSILPEGSQVSLNIFLRDITDQQKLEEKLRQSQKMQAIGQLAGGVAHDFNNLLTVIQGNAGLIDAWVDEETENAEAVSEILLASERASGLTRQLLAFSRQQPIKQVELDINESVSSSCAMLERLIGEDIELDVKLGAFSSQVFADPVMLEQVLLNLAVNGRDAMPHGGCLTIETSLSGAEMPKTLNSENQENQRFVRIDICDTGTGISEENLPHIFEPFFSTKDVGKGTGLGLATVFGIVEQHGGWVTVKSEVGIGTMFSVFLPAVTESIHGSESRRAHPPEAPRLNMRNHSETILLAEDEKMVRMVAQKILTRQGYRVLEAGNGREALEIWKKHMDEIDLLFTDIVMPEGMSGHDLAQRVHEDRPDLKVIYCSGYSAEIFRGEAVFPENAAFLGKPYDVEEMLTKVRAAFEDDVALPS